VEVKREFKERGAFELYNFEEERVVYAFVVDNKEMYVGICSNTNTTLKKRMRRYQSRQGRAVKIFTLKPESLPYKGLNVDLVKGFENPLIERLNPKWNIQK